MFIQQPNTKFWCFVVTLNVVRFVITLHANGYSGSEEGKIGRDGRSIDNNYQTIHKIDGTK